MHLSLKKDRAVTKLAPRQPLPRVSIADRETYILRYCQGKRVLHLGCAAWPYTAELAQTGSLLHQKLEKVCSALGGIDISEEGNSLLRTLGMKNVYTADESRIDEIIRDLGWAPEVIVAGEIIEHIDSPGPFLEEYRRYMDRDCTLLVTVPNAFSMKSLLHVLLGHEKVNRDHVAYYSYATIKQLLARHGLEIVQVRCYTERTDHLVQKAVGALLYPLLWVRPYLSDGLILSCRARFVAK
jgi:2-polyprenyl-3-methyl-5-hydroxy-6-metoxy-1,4-benzoquinol methylase